MLSQFGRKTARDQRGFSLIEMLIAVFIVGLALTVFLQLLSGSMRLKSQSSSLLNYTTRADEIFSYLLTRDIKDETFVWQAEAEKGHWRLQLLPVEIRKPVEAEDPEVRIDLPTELFMLRFTFYSPEDRPVTTLELVRQYPLGYFSEDFLAQHLAVEDQQGAM